MSGSRGTLMITAVIAVLLWPLSSANVRYTTQITYLNHSVSRACTEMRKMSSGVISDMKSFDELCSYEHKPSESYRTRAGDWRVRTNKKR